MHNGLRLQKLVFAAKLPPNQKLFLLAIAERLGTHQDAWPGYGDLQALTGLSRRTLIRVRTDLEQAGIITVSGEGQSSNVYTPNYDGLAALAQDRPKRQRGAAVTSVRETPPSVTVTPDLVSGRHHHGVTVTPERPRERPPQRSKNAPPRDEQGKGDLRSERGKRERLSAFIKNHEVEERVAGTETILGDTLSPSTRPVESVAASTVKVFDEVKEEEGRYPSSEETADAVADPVFAGLRGLSFGLLTSKAMAPKFKQQLIRRIRNTKLTNSLLGQNNGDRHDRNLEEMKRETEIGSRVLGGGPARLPLWLERLSKEKPDDPDVQEMVAGELAKPRSCEPTTVPPARPGRAERPIGYDLMASIEADLLAVTLEE